MKKRLLALFLAQAMIFGSVATPVYGADSSGATEYADELLTGVGDEEILSDESVAEEALEDLVLDEAGNLEEASMEEEEITDTGTDADDEEETGEIIDETVEETEDLEEVPEETEEVLEEAEEVPEDLEEIIEDTSEEENTEAPSEEEAKALEEQLKTEEEAGKSEIEVTPLLEEELAAQEEVLIGKPAASDVRVYDAAEGYAQALIDINMEYPGNYDAKIVLDLEEGKIENEDGEEVVGADSTVLAAMGEEDAAAAAAVLEEKGYDNVTCADGVVTADDPYVTARLYVMSTEPVDTRGALSVVTFGETNFIQYASPAEAAIAAEMLKDDPGVWSVVPDLIMDVETVAEEDAEDYDLEDAVGAEENPDTEEVGADDPEVEEISEEELEQKIIEIEQEVQEEAAEAEEAEQDPEEEPELEIETTGEDDFELLDESEGEEVAVDEEEVGKHFENWSTYMSKSVTYMSIQTLLNRSGSVNNAVNVAVIDTGYDTSSRCVSYKRVLKDRGVCLAGGSMHDANGHGTFVLNQIYEATNSSVKFIPINMYDDYGYSPLSMAEAAIYQAVYLGADVINYSNGCDMGSFGETFPAGENALQYALNNKCYLVAAAGNDSENAYYCWPANSSKCLTVSSISYNTGYLASYSNYGSCVDFAAPGGDYGELILGYTRNNEKVYYAGTSQAAPYVTACIANLKANGRSYNSLSALISGLSSFCDSSLTSESSFYVGHGCINLAKSVNRTLSLASYKKLGSYTYKGTAIKPNPTVKYGKHKLKKNRDYIIRYSKNVNAGVAKINVIGRGFYKGTVTRSFKILPRSIAKGTVRAAKLAYSYTGNYLKPAVTVKVNGKVLKKGTDYTVKYYNNKGPGRALIVVTGKGNYKGTNSFGFGIFLPTKVIKPGYTYILVPKAARNRAVSLKQGEMANNTRLWLNTKTCSEDQQIRISRNSDGTFTLRSMKCEMAVDSHLGKSTVGAAAVIRDYKSSSKSQKWILRRLSDNSYVFINKNSKLALTSVSSANHAVLTMRKRTNAESQRFYLQRVSTEVVKRPHLGINTLRASGNTGYVMDVYGASKKSGARLQIYKANGSKAQKFRFVYSGKNTFRIVNVNSGKVLMPTGGKAKKYAAIVQGTWTGKLCQRWKLLRQSDGKYLLHNCAGYYLEITGNTVKNGAKLRLNVKSTAKRCRWVKRRIG